MFDLHSERRQRPRPFLLGVGGMNLFCRSNVCCFDKNAVSCNNKIVSLDLPTNDLRSVASFNAALNAEFAKTVKSLSCPVVLQFSQLRDGVAGESVAKVLGSRRNCRHSIDASKFKGIVDSSSVISI